MLFSCIQYTYEALFYQTLKALIIPNQSVTPLAMDRKNTSWPDDFDFGEDELCQDVFKPFIKSELRKLEDYDHQRKATAAQDITYIFHEHTNRVGENVFRSCMALGLGERVANNMRWAVMPHDIGKRLLPPSLWDSEEKPSGTIKKIRRTHTLLGVQIVNEFLPDIEHPFKDLMLDIMKNHHEHMDGSGTHGLKAEDLSLPVRLAAIIEAYDGYRIWRPHFGTRDITPAGVLKRMREEKGAEIYDMELFEAFAKMKMDDYKHGRTLQDI